MTLGILTLPTHEVFCTDFISGVRHENRRGDYGVDHGIRSRRDI